jgi:hypothetical protein
MHSAYDCIHPKYPYNLSFIRRRSYMNEFGARLATRTSAGLLGATLLAGCGGSSKSPEVPRPTFSTQKPTVEQVCLPSNKSKWGITPSNFNAEHIAEALGVSPADVAQNGRFGNATCPKPVSLDRVASTNPPIVAVTGEGDLCLAIGSVDVPPTPGAMTEKILAVCVERANI